MRKIVTEYMEIYGKTLEDIIWVAENTSYIGMYVDAETIKKLKRISNNIDLDILRRKEEE